MRKIDSKVLFVAFPLAMGTKIAGYVRDVLDCELCDFIEEGDQDKLEALSESYDFIFIYGEVVKSIHLDFFSEIRRIFSTADLFVVSVANDYQLALTALRAGVKDIISYPVNQREFGSILSRAHALRKSQYSQQGGWWILEFSRNFWDIESFTSFKQVFQTVQAHLLSQPFVTEVTSFCFNLKKEKGFFNFGLEGEIELSPSELVALSQKEGSDYYQKETSIYIHLFNDHEGSHFLLLKTNDYLNGFALDSFLKMITFAVRSFYGYVKKKLSEEKMTFLAHTDDVTGLYNQRRLYKDIDKNIASVKAKGGCFSLIFLDIDKFKDINDEYGHIIGSKLLMQVAGVIRRVIRETDYIYRYGGDEFVIIIPSVKAEDAVKIGERLLKAVGSQKFIAGSDQIFKLEVSIGIAEYPADAERREDILAIADRMMYQAKKSGRGRVCLVRHQQTERLLS